MMITGGFLDGLVAASWEFLSAPAIETVASTTIKFRRLLNWNQPINKRSSKLKS